MRISAVIAFLLFFNFLGSPDAASAIANTFVPAIPPQSGAEMDELLNWANRKQDAGKHSEAILIAMEVFEQSVALDDKDRMVQACLLVSRAQLSLGHRHESLEFALRGLNASMESNKELELASYLTLITLFNDWGLSDKVLEKIGIIEQNQLLDKNTQKIMWLWKAKHAENTGKYDVAVSAYADLLEDARKNGDQKLISEYLTGLSRVEWVCKNLDQAIAFEKHMLADFLEQNDKSSATVCANNLGLLYGRTGTYDISLDYYRQALSYRPDKKLSPVVRLNLATAQSKLHLYEDAMVTCSETLDELKENPDPELLCETWLLQSWVFDHSSRQSLAKESALKAASMAEKNELGIKAQIYRHLSTMYSRDHAFEEAQAYSLMASKEEAAALKQKQTELSHYQELKLAVEKEERLLWSEIQAEQEEKLLEKQQTLDEDNKEKTMAILRYEKELSEAQLEREKIARENAHKELILAQAELQKQVSEKTIVELKQKKNEQDLVLAQEQLSREAQEKNILVLQGRNKELDSEHKIQEVELKKKRATVRVSLAGGSVALLLTCFLLLAYRSSQRKKAVIEMQNSSISTINNQLSQKNKEITDSIEYASFIQHSLVPVQDILNSAQKRHFMHYWPLESVSGDLPFAIIQDRKLFVAAIDCIGHGVPAAMLSFMVYYNLKDLIENDPDKECGELLTELDKRIVQTMDANQTQREYRSSVDLTLCKIHLDTNAVDAAGAGNSVVIQDKNGTRRVRGNTGSICDNLHTAHNSFQTIHEQLNPGDRLFMFTDGLNHQLGGPENRRKFTRKRIHALIEQGAKKGVETIGNHVMDALVEWKGENDQTDDILFIGIEI